MLYQRVSSYLRGASGSCCSGCTSPPGAARPSWHRTRSRPCGRRRSHWSAAEAAGRMWWWWSPPSTCPGCSCWPLPASCRAGSCSAGWSPPEEAQQDINPTFLQPLSGFCSLSSNSKPYGRDMAGQRAPGRMFMDRLGNEVIVRLVKVRVCLQLVISYLKPKFRNKPP